MRSMRKYFLAGLAVLLPVVLTIYVLFLTFQFFDNLLGRFITRYMIERFGFYVPGIGLIITFISVIVFGFFTVHFFGKRLFPFIEKLFIKLPLVHKIYPTLKQVINVIISTDKPTLKQVVLVEYPRKEVYSLGFMANEEGMEQARDKLKKDLVNVFIPSSPGPLTGFFVMVPRHDVIVLDIRPEEAIKMIISGGVFNPQDLLELKKN